VKAAARTLGLQIDVLRAGTSQEIETAFATFARERPDALFVGPDAFFTDRRIQLVNLSSCCVMPTAYGARDFAEAGGLMSYGASLTDTYRQVGAYAGRMLKGEKPADLPVQAPTKYALVINLKTAKALGITVPASLLARAAEVIE
jgi:ABC-type uncharacterized transport system substrate-binding protein